MNLNSNKKIKKQLKIKIKKNSLNKNSLKLQTIDKTSFTITIKSKFLKHQWKIFFFSLLGISLISSVFGYNNIKNYQNNYFKLKTMFLTTLKGENNQRKLTELKLHNTTQYWNTLLNSTIKQQEEIDFINNQNYNKSSFYNTIKLKTNNIKLPIKIDLLSTINNYNKKSKEIKDMNHENPNQHTSIIQQKKLYLQQDIMNFKKNLSNNFLDKLLYIKKDKKLIFLLTPTPLLANNALNTDSLITPDKKKTSVYKKTKVHYTSELNNLKQYFHFNFLQFFLGKSDIKGKTILLEEFITFVKKVIKEKNCTIPNDIEIEELEIQFPYFIMEDLKTSLKDKKDSKETTTQIKTIIKTASLNFNIKLTDILDTHNLFNSTEKTETETTETETTETPTTETPTTETPTTETETTETPTTETTETETTETPTTETTETTETETNNEVS